ncbi:MAG: hypothetical protein NTX88_08685 [Candidatus Atribacteria bacterium]|nr:hypothetical protein [Candidatus Atribacteria bacterium]
MGQVSIVRSQQNLKDSLIQALELIGGISRYFHKNDRVLLKPNLNGKEGTSSQAVVEALMQLLLDFPVRSRAGPFPRHR